MISINSANFGFLKSDSPQLVRLGTKHDDQTDSTSQALDWIKNRPTYPVSEYNLRKALKLGAPIYKWMLDEFDEDQEPVRCPECKAAPTCYGRSCSCQSCGQQWELPNPFNSEETVPTCRLPDGSILFWEESRGLWINHETGATYPPGPE